MAFTLYSFAIGFAFPLLLIAAFYSCVVRKLRQAASGPAASVSSSRRSRTRETTNRRIEHLVMGIICTYTICWMPYWIAQLAVSLDYNGKIPAFYQFFMVGTALSYTNSALNPILYAFLSDNFKRRCSEVFASIMGLRRWLPGNGCCARRPHFGPAPETHLGGGGGGGGGGETNTTTNKQVALCAGQVQPKQQRQTLQAHLQPPQSQSPLSAQQPTPAPQPRPCLATNNSIDMQHSAACLLKQPEMRQASSTTTTVIFDDQEPKSHV